MKNIIIANSPKQNAIRAIDAFLADPERLHGFTVRGWVVAMFGGQDCLETFYDHRDALVRLQDVVDNHKEELSFRYNVVDSFLSNAVLLAQSLIEDGYIKAELTRDFIEDEHIECSDEYLDNLARQYEVKLQLAKLEAEERRISQRADERKAA